MDPMLLLNPKGYAKAKAQEAAKQKKAPSYGPSQSRKPTAAPPPKGGDGKPTVVSYDPAALLNPEAAIGLNRASNSTNGKAAPNAPSAMAANHYPGPPDQDYSHGPGTSSLIERQYGVVNREAPLPSKRKSQGVDENEEDNGIDRKKARSTFNTNTNGGIIGNHMRTEREKFAAESNGNNAPVDLTNKDDEEELIFVSETKREDTREVCLGKITGRAMIFRIPRSTKTNKSAVPTDFWSTLRIYYRRTASQNQVIDLVDRNPDGGNALLFAKLDSITAAALCPLIDGSTVSKMSLKMFLLPFPRQPGDREGGQASRSIPLTIVIFSPLNKAQGIGTYLSQKQLFLSPPPPMAGRLEFYNPQEPIDRGPVKSKKMKVSGHTTYGVARTEEEMRRDAEGLLETLFEETKVRPQMELDSDLITTPLMSHQKEALAFLTHHERSDQELQGEEDVFSLWKSRVTPKGEVWYNTITNHESRTKPERMRGGLLADMMGLGKTLSIIALLVSTAGEARAFGEEETSPDLEDAQRNSKATLIICPKSVLSNWLEQIQQHVKRGALKVYTYHGPARMQDLDELAEYDVVLTTYSTVAAEWSDRNKRRNALASINWFRIVLDEAHQIRTQSTQNFLACHALEAQRRWAVTGTPVQNRLDDFGALVRFLHVKPFDDGTSWATHILAPFRNGQENASNNLKLIVHGITLRRMKDRIGMDKRDEKISRLDFSDEELVDYKMFSQNSNRQLKLMLKEHGHLKGKSYSHVLKCVHRLRMYSVHGRELLHEDDLKELEGLTASTAIDLGDEPNADGTPDDTFISEKHAYETLEMMSDGESDTCTSCGEQIIKKGDVESDEDDSSSNDGTSDDNSSDNGGEYTSDTLGYLTPCYHLICPRCKDDHIDKIKPELTADAYHVCSYCEQYVRFGLYEYTRSKIEEREEARRQLNRKRGKAKFDDATYSGPSTKVKALLNDLEKMQAETALLPPNEPPFRAVVFTGWTSYIDLIEYAFDNANIGFARLDGTMSVRTRAEAIKTFRSDLTIIVMLVSIKAGGQGLNFTAANRVFMMEPQFNPGVEEQAIDRVDRLGQTRPVVVRHYIMRDSVEEGILKLQEKKKALAKMSMETKKGAKGDDQKKKIEELKDLFK